MADRCPRWVFLLRAPCSPRGPFPVSTDATHIAARYSLAQWEPDVGARDRVQISATPRSSSFLDALLASPHLPFLLPAASASGLVVEIALGIVSGIVQLAVSTTLVHEFLQLLADLEEGQALG